MTGNEFQNYAMRTNDGGSTNRLKNTIEVSPVDLGGLLNGCLGLTGEAGEFCDMVKKWVFHEKNVDIDHMKKEIGDVMWYVAMICHSMGWKLDEILQMNVDKLKARYPEGFDVIKANNRKVGDV